MDIVVIYSSVSEETYCFDVHIPAMVIAEEILNQMGEDWKIEESESGYVITDGDDFISVSIKPILELRRISDLKF